MQWQGHHIGAAITGNVGLAPSRHRRRALEQTPPVESEPPLVPTAAAPRRRRIAPGTLLGLVAGLVGLAALGASAWVYAQTQRDIVRLSTELAQVRLSLELFGRQQGTPSGTDNASLEDLTNRLTILEDNWREPAAAPALPETPEAASAGAASAGDCLPTGTRFLVTAGDSYPICGIAGSIAIGSVDNGFLSLADGTIIASGGTIAMPGTSCMIGVVSAGEDGMTGFAEIRVSC
jgi:hypothetical protein